MFSFIKSLFRREDAGLRKVPGTFSASNASGRVVYNALDPWMQQFMGRCVAALKKAGIHAKGTGQFSIRLGDDGQKELSLDVFWSRYATTQSAAEFDAVVAEARRLLS